MCSRFDVIHTTLDKVFLLFKSVRLVLSNVICVCMSMCVCLCVCVYVCVCV